MLMKHQYKLVKIQKPIITHVCSVNRDRKLAIRRVFRLWRIPSILLKNNIGRFADKVKKSKGQINSKREKNQINSKRIVKMEILL